MDRPPRDSDYQLLWPGTLVVRVTSAGHRLYGVVDEYEHYAVHQKLFPVRFGSRTTLMTSMDVQERIDVIQPGDRRPPPKTGRLAFSSDSESLPVPAQRAGSPAAEDPVEVAATA